MKASFHSRPAGSRAFTLIEILMVIVIIGILAALTLTAVVHAITKRRIATATLQISQITQAIESYHSHYGGYPVSAATMSAAAKSDFTFGGASLGSALGPGNWTANNGEVIAILMDLETDGSGNPTVNKGHVKNPGQMKLLNATMVTGTTDPGVGSDLVYRDPWGNPYIISLDLNYDEQCKDALYGRQGVSQQAGATGFNGLVNSTDTGGNDDNFLHRGGVMVWSLGPDKTAVANANANVGANRDNILSWK